MPKVQLWLTLGLALAFVAGAVSLAIWSENHLSDPSVVVPDTTYDMAEISAHNTPEDCWVIVEGNVYNMSTYIDRHPGGSHAIAVMCGFDATNAFLSMPDAVIPAARLAMREFLIGTLSK